LHVDAEVRSVSVQPLPISLLLTNKAETHVIPVDLAERAEVLLSVGLAAKVVEEVKAELLCRDRRACEGLDVVFDVGQEVVETADCALQVKEEV
jgi:hypothetical protein